MGTYLPSTSKCGRRKVLDQFLVDLLSGLSDIVEPRAVTDKLGCGRKNLGHHLWAARALQHEMIVTVFFMVQRDYCRLDPPDGDFRNPISHFCELRWVLGRIS